jgi:hypothetical protein
VYKSSPRPRSHHRRWTEKPLSAASCPRHRWVIAAACLALAPLTIAFRANAADPPPPEQKTKIIDGLKVPEWWPDEQPLPREKSNCVKCHVSAGRELSLAVIDFTHSIHDKNKQSCYDCHGGNTENDVLAHDDRFGFIGTKLSAHQARCAECHKDQAAQLAKGPHAWDFSTRINTDYPLCIDCHGHHDVANPPADFKLMNVCLDCHEDLDTKYKPYADIVKENDLLWVAVQKVRNLDIEAPNPIPRPLRRPLADLSKATMPLIHGLPKISDQQARDLNAQSTKMRAQLDEWAKTAN